MQTRTELLNLLFDEWEQSILDYKGKFVKDGIINEDRYYSAKPKILFITKEPNNPDQNEGDFRSWWMEEVKYTFAYRIAEWSYGILNGFPEYDEVWKSNRSRKALQQIAFMNIKKIGGGGSSQLSMMTEHLKMNFRFIHRQIDIIEPDIIITGTTWGELRNQLFPQTKWIQSGYDILVGRHKKAKVIDYYHPSSRTPPAASYSLLQNIVLSEKFKRL